MTNLPFDNKPVNVSHYVDVENGRIVAKTPFILKDVCKSIPGAKWDSELKAWTYPATPFTAHSIHTKFPHTVHRRKTFLELVQSKGEIEAADKSIKSGTVDLPQPDVRRTDGWKHQVQAFHFALNKPATMLAMDMGTGKSKVAIDVIQNAKAKRVLIVGPKSATNIWPKEFEKHWRGGDLVVQLLNKGKLGDRLGNAKLQLGIVNETDPNITLVQIFNYDVIWREPTRKYLQGVDWDIIIADESHKLKAPGGAASKAMAQIGKKAKRRLCLTGTPLAHSPMDAYGQYRFLDPGIFGTSFHLFKHTYAVWGGYGGYQLLGYQNQDEFNQRFYSIAFRVGKDALDLPPVMHTVRSFDLDEKSKKYYKELFDDFVTYVEQEEVTVSNALVKLLRMRQITSGHLPTDGGWVSELHKDRMELLTDVFEEMGDEPVVVFAEFRHDLNQIREAAEKSGREYFELSGRGNELEQWKESKGVIGVQIQAGGVGIDLTHARYCVYYSIGFSLGNYEQSLARVHRPGQTRPVTYVHLVANDTIDEKVYQALQNRKDVIEAVLEELR